MGTIGGPWEPMIACTNCREKVPLKAMLRANAARVLICPSCARDNAERLDALTVPPV